MLAPDVVEGVTEDAVGHMLRLLRTAGLVTGERRGRAVFHRLAAGPEPLREGCLRRLVALSSEPGAAEDVDGVDEEDRA